MTKTKVCVGCRKEKDETLFYLHSRNRKPTYRNAFCIECSVDPEARRRSREKYRKAHKEEISAYRRSPKFLAGKKLYYAVSVGKIIKPKRCSVCKRRCPPNELHGHHKDYSKALEVIWLCHSCHHKEHHPLKRVNRGFPIRSAK